MDPAMKRIGAVILAAGSSTRLGRPKQLLPLDGEPLLRVITRRAIVAGFAPVVVVVGAEEESCRAAVAGLGARIACNSRWAEGVGTSVAAGVAALAEGEVDAALLAVCDQPRLSVEALRRLLAAFRDGGMVAARYAQTLGTPAIFAAEYFPALRTLAGDSGAKQLLCEHSAEVVAIDLPEAETDIDLASDWEKFGRGITR